MRCMEKTMSYRKLVATLLSLALLACLLAAPAFAAGEEGVEGPSVIDSTWAWIVEALGFSARDSEKAGAFVNPNGQPTDSGAPSDGDTLTSDDSGESADTEGGGVVIPNG